MKNVLIAGVVRKDLLEVKHPVWSLLHHPVQRHTERDDEVPAEVWVGGKEGARGDKEKERWRKKERDRALFQKLYQRLHTLTEG